MSCPECAELRERAERLRETVLEAEAEVEQDGSPETRFYAIGLRHAAGILGLPEGVDPVTRKRMLDLQERGGDK